MWDLGTFFFWDDKDKSNKEIEMHKGKLKVRVETTKDATLLFWFAGMSKEDSLVYLSNSYLLSKFSFKCR